MLYITCTCCMLYAICYNYMLYAVCYNYMLYAVCYNYMLYAICYPYQLIYCCIAYSRSPTQTSRMWRTQSIPALDGKADYTRCFRLNDLEQGEVIGQGFYGSVCKVCFVLRVQDWNSNLLSWWQSWGGPSHTHTHTYTQTHTHTHTHTHSSFSLSLSLMCQFANIVVLFQVRHRFTGQVMVMKEMRHASNEAKLSFLKEVSISISY